MNKLNALLIAIVATASMAFAQTTPYEMTVTSSQSSAGSGTESYVNPNNWTGAGFSQASTQTSNGNGYGTVQAYTNDQTNVGGYSNVTGTYANSNVTGTMYTGFTSNSGPDAVSCGSMSFNAWGNLNLGAASFLSNASSNFVGAEALTSGSFSLCGTNFPLGVYGNGQLSQSANTVVNLGTNSFSATSTTSSWASACPVVTK
jgi:hypothetical protein